MTVTVGGTALAAVKADDEGKWSVTVPGNKSYVKEGKLSLKAVASKDDHTDGTAMATVEVDLTAPTVSYTAPASLMVDATEMIKPTIPDTVMDIKDYALATGQTLPAGLVLNKTTGVVSGAPTTRGTRATTTTISVRDQAGNSAAATLSLPRVEGLAQTLSGFAYDPDEVELGDDAPTLTAPTGAVGALSYSASPASVCTVDAASGALTINAEGTCTVTATAAATTTHEAGRAGTRVTVGACQSDPEARPHASREVVLESDTQWAEPVNGQTAEEKREQRQRQTRSVTWNEGTCAWDVGEWEDSGDPRWTPWAATGVTRAAPAKPDESRDVVKQTQTRWAEPVDGQTPEEGREKRQRQTRSVTWNKATCTWDVGEWEDSGDPWWTAWAATGVTRAAPTKPDDKRVVVLDTETRWAEPVNGQTAEEKREQRQRQTRSVTWNKEDCAWDTGEWDDSGDPWWTAWTATGVTRTAPEKPVGSRVVVSDTEIRWAEPVNGQTAEEKREERQLQTRSVTWNKATCTWDVGEWEDSGDPWWTAWAATGVTVPAPAKPDGGRVKVLDTETRWATPVNGQTAEEEREQRQRQTRSVTWNKADCAWDTGDWKNSGSTWWTGWTATGDTVPEPARPDASRETVLRSETRWAEPVNGQTAEEKRERRQRQTRSLTWNKTDCAWDTGEWKNSGTARWTAWAATGTTMTAPERPADDVVTVVIARNSQTRWVPVDDGIFCLEHEERRRGVRRSYYLRPHVWSTSTKGWVDGTRNATPYFTEPVFSYGSWERTGNSRLCPLGAGEEGASGESETSSGYKPAELAAGDHRLEWGDDVVAFTVPEKVTLELRARRSDSGTETLVFRTTDGIELTVDPSQLSADQSRNAALFSEVTDEDLSALAGTLRLAEPAATGTGGADEATDCVSLVASADGTASVDLAASPCAVLRGGGPVTVNGTDGALTVTLTSGRDWLLLSAPHEEEATFASFWFVDLDSGAGLALSPSTGAELWRQLGSGSVAQLDAIAASVSVKPSPGN